MAQIEVPLQKGITLKDSASGKEVKHTLAVLRETTVDDLLDAALESESLRVHPETGEAVLISSPTLEAMHTLRRQIVSIGDIKGPLTFTELRKLDPRDLNLLQKHAMLLDNAGLDASKQRGESDGDREPDSPG